MWNNQKNVIVFMLFLTCSLIGCVSIPVGQEIWPVDDIHLPINRKEVIMVEKFYGCHFEVFYEDGDVSKAYCTLWADGEFRITRADNYSLSKKIAFGICPGTLSRCQQGGDMEKPSVFCISLIHTCICSCLVFPLIDSIMFEPFSEFNHDINDSNISRFSVFGFCKYWDTDTAMAISKKYSKVVDKIQLDDFGVTFHGQKNNYYGHGASSNHNNGVRIINDDMPYPRKVGVEISRIGKYQGNISEFLKDFEGSTFELEY